MPTTVPPPDYPRRLMLELSLRNLPVPNPARGKGREHRFHPTRKWLMDLAYPEWKIAIEIHGNTFNRKGKSRHTTGPGFQEDRIKMREAAILGWLVLEYTSAELVKDPGSVCDSIKRAIEARTT